MSDGIHGHGTTLAGATAGTVGNIMTIGGPSQVRDPIETSTMDSTTKDREFISGMKDAGEMTIELNYDGSASGNADSLNTAYNLGAAEIWTITLPDTSTYAALGFITALEPAIPFDDKVTQSLTIKLTGPMTYTDAAA